MRLALLAILFLLIPTATAHGDQPSLAGEWTLGPGESLEFERSVHWHRLMGQLDATGPIVFVANGDVLAGPSTELVLNKLVRCCDATWTDLTFAIENPGSQTVTVRGDVAFLHDNLAVVTDNSEPGGWWQALLIIGLLLTIPALRARTSAPGDAPRWLLASRITHAAAWTAAGTASIIGMARFGGGPLVGTLGATAWFPAGFGQFLNTHALVMLGFMALWGAGYACLAGARRRGALRPVDGYIYAGAPVVLGISGLLEFGGGWIVPVVALVPSLIVLVDMHWHTLCTLWTRTLSPREG